MDDDIKAKKEEIIQCINEMNEKEFLDFIWHLEKMCVDFRLEESSDISQEELKNLKGIEDFCTKTLKENGHA